MNISRMLATAAATAALTVAAATPALAIHSHVLIVPGTCVDKGGAGFGTGEVHDHASFHSRVHTGIPGAKAFANEHNPVSVEGNRLCP